MNIEERAAAAAELKATGKCNCTQSVVKVFEDMVRFLICGCIQQKPALKNLHMPDMLT